MKCGSCSARPNTPNSPTHASKTASHSSSPSACALSRLAALTLRSCNPTMSLKGFCGWEKIPCLPPSFHDERRSQTHIPGMTQMAVWGPFNELKLPDERWRKPPAIFHFLGRQPLSPSAAPRLRKVGERAFCRGQGPESLE